MRNRLIKLILTVAISSCVLVQPLYAAQDKTSANTEETLNYLKDIMDMVKEKHKGEVTDKQLIDGALKGMFDSMDPYTAYFTNEEAENFFSGINGSYKGIGISMSTVGEFIVVMKVFAGSPADKAGLLAGDKIVSVDDKSLIGISTDEAVSLIRGEAGTKITLGIARDGQDDIKKIEVVRAEIKVNPVTYQIKNGIGYIKLEEFNSNTNEYITKALNELDKQDVKKVILDLRNNPGGGLDQAIAVAQNFVPKGLITKLDYQSERDKDEEYHSGLKEVKYKLVVLVNKMSASASEIVAGAVQDTKAGTLIGTKTFGKSKVQQIIPILTPEASRKYEAQVGTKIVNAYDLREKGIFFKDEDILGWTKITVGEYTTPKGRSIEKLKGLDPDIMVEDYSVRGGIDINNIQTMTKTTKPVLKSEGIDVFNAEKILKLSGYDIDVPDTKMDQKTVKAMMKFQKDNKLYPYGVMDFATQQALNNKLEKLILEIDKQYAKAVEVLNK